MRSVKLSKSQAQLVESWRNEIGSVMQTVGRLGDKYLNMNLTIIASELNIDLENEAWSFDFKDMAFKESGEPTPTIPGRNSRRKKGLEPSGGENPEDTEQGDEDGLKDAVNVGEVVSD